MQHFPKLYCVPFFLYSIVELDRHKSLGNTDLREYNGLSVSLGSVYMH